MVGGWKGGRSSGGGSFHSKAFDFSNRSNYVTKRLIDNQFRPGVGERGNRQGWVGVGGWRLRGWGFPFSILGSTFPLNSLYRFLFALK